MINEKYRSRGKSLFFKGIFPIYKNHVLEIYKKIKDCPIQNSLLKN